METNSSNLQILVTSDLSKTSAQIAADSMIPAMLEDPINGMVKLKFIKTIVEKVEAEVKDRFKDQMFRQPGGKLVIPGTAEIQYQQGYDVPDYEADDTYRMLKEKLKAREELLKAAFKTQKPLQDGDEVIPVVPLKSATADKVNITLAK